MKTLTSKKAKRQIIRIDEDKCTGCGECIPNCPEGALQIIDNKARLISDLFCDGLGACIGHCPEDAISTEERDAEPYEEKTVMANIVKQGANTIKAHLEHLKAHKQDEYLQQAIEFLNEKHIKIPSEVVAGHKEPRKHSGTAPSEHEVTAESEHQLPCGCPGSSVRSFAPKPEAASKSAPSVRAESQLTQWPVQLMLVPPGAPFLKNSDLVIAADCVSYAYANFHQDFLTGKSLLIACPKLDDTEIYLDKLTQMFKTADIKSITLLHMEVPCCFGLVHLVKQALANSGQDIPTKEVNISVQGEIKS